MKENSTRCIDSIRQLVKKTFGWFLEGISPLAPVYYAKAAVKVQR